MSILALGAMPKQQKEQLQLLLLLLLQASRQAVVLDGEPLELIGKFKYLGSMANILARVPRRSGTGIILSDPHSLACNSAFGRGVKYRCVQRQVVVYSILLNG